MCVLGEDVGGVSNGGGVVVEVVVVVVVGVVVAYWSWRSCGGSADDSLCNRGS